MDFFLALSVYHVVAWVGTGLALMFLILMFLGLDDVLDGYFIQRISVAFACGFGWMGVILTGNGWTSGPILIASILVGLFCAGIPLGTLIGLKCLAQVSNEELKALVGKTGEVLASTRGDNELKVNVMFQGRLQEMMATKDTKDFLGSGVSVKIKEVLPTGRLIVSSLD